MNSGTLAAIVAVLLVIILLLGLLVRYQERVIFPGTKLPADYRFIEEPGLQETTIAVDGAHLSALHYRQPDARGLIFFLHGNAGNLATWVPDVDFYREEKYDLFMLDYRGYGKSTGNIESQAQLEQDVLTAWQSVAPDYQARDLPLVIYGRSIGTYFAARLALQAKPDQLVLVSPYTSLLAMARKRFPGVPTSLVRYPLDTDKIIPQLNCPVLLLLGGNDALIPVDHAHS
ncbi:MAG: alpha/beta fold hydrolase, partial [Pseudomonadales bacterium]|nr:alpha/beta fold hydrolase [Pseudomonadales bacterium]